MRVIVLGSAAGGGVPQWNCRCRVCALAWAGSERVHRRTETGLAVSRDGTRWVLLDAAPELRQQILNTPALHPRGPGRGSPIEAVVLTGGDVDHVAGLLGLREAQGFTLYGTEPTLLNLRASAIFDVLRPDIVTRRVLVPEIAVDIAGLSVTAFAVPGKVPLYREGDTVVVGEATTDVVGLAVEDGNSRILYVPGLARLPDALRDRLADADLLLLEGTTFTDDELLTAGVSAKTAGRMGHLAMGGPGGSLAAFAASPARRRVYLHLNNTNPALIEDAPERMIVTDAGWTVAHDGMSFVL